MAQIIELLNKTPGQLSIRAKFASVTQNDAKGIGFDWTIGNVLLNNGRHRRAAWHGPSLSRPCDNREGPSGVFPGNVGAGTTTAAAASDGVLTSGLRNNFLGNNAPNLPTLATVSGILTDPQFRIAVQALEATRRHGFAFRARSG